MNSVNSIEEEYSIVETYLAEQVLETDLPALIQQYRSECSRLRATLKAKHGITNSNGLRYKCKFCKKEFSKSTALGGHISKTHREEKIVHNCLQRSLSSLPQAVSSDNEMQKVKNELSIMEES